jgi:hypothetical protein
MEKKGKFCPLVNILIIDRILAKENKYCLRNLEMVTWQVKLDIGIFYVGLCNSFV